MSNPNDITKFNYNNVNAEELSHRIINIDFKCKFYGVSIIIVSSIPQRNSFNPLSANPTKWSNALKQFVGNLPTNCLSVFDHFVKLTLKRLILTKYYIR